MTQLQPFNIEKLRKDFPCLHQQVHQKPLVYLDSAATAQKPQCVIDAMTAYYQSYAGNVNRGAHYLSEQATKHYQGARGYVAQFINADERNIVFTRGATESINLIAHCLGKFLFEPGDEIILTHMEHHSNIVPWYLLAQEKNLQLKVASVRDDGSLDLEHFKSLFSKRTKLAAFTHVSNALGTINPIQEMVAFAKSFDAVVVIDGAQAAPHLKIDVHNIGCDFYCFSGHKVYGPSGIGVLFAKSPWLDRMPPYQGGGDMIESVSFQAITFAQGPQKFEAGTPNISGAIGLAQALTYLNQLGLSSIHEYEQDLLRYCTTRLLELEPIKIIGVATPKVSLVSFVVEGVHPHDISSILDREGIAIRAGHLCAQPLMARFKIPALSRVSLSFYNTRCDVDRLIEALKKVFEVFRL